MGYRRHKAAAFMLCFTLVTGIAAVVGVVFAQESGGAPPVSGNPQDIPAEAVYLLDGQSYERKRTQHRIGFVTGFVDGLEFTARQTQYGGQELMAYAACARKLGPHRLMVMLDRQLLNDQGVDHLSTPAAVSLNRVIETSCDTD